MFGSNVKLGVDDYALAYCKNWTEFRTLLEYCCERKWLLRPSAYAHGLPSVWDGKAKAAFQLTADGFAELEARAKANIESERAFVAMRFSDEMKPIYEQAIKPAIETDAGFRAILIDAEEFNGAIVDEILAEIRQARFIVADFTHHRQNVYFEAGFALALGLPTIFTCRDDQKCEIHFDIAHYNLIPWDGPATLRDRLANRIKATIGVGPHYKP